MPITRLSEWVLVSQRWTRMSQMSNYQVHDKVEPELVFVMIPGNPGNEGFYEHFGQKILEEMEENSIKLKMDFYTVSHLNHVELPQRMEKSSKLGKHGQFFAFFRFYLLFFR
uniref:Uncharacterized protein n=1 Tax=Panagrolaimus sp. JU765 TaxID=591449 RepID=A0AC34QBE1_9BILA